MSPSRLSGSGPAIGGAEGLDGILAIHPELAGLLGEAVGHHAQQVALTGAGGAGPNEGPLRPPPAPTLATPGVLVATSDVPRPPPQVGGQLGDSRQPLAGRHLATGDQP